MHTIQIFKCKSECIAITEMPLHMTKSIRFFQVKSFLASVLMAEVRGKAPTLRLPQSSPTRLCPWSRARKTATLPQQQFPATRMGWSPPICPQFPPKLDMLAMIIKSRVIYQPHGHKTGENGAQSGNHTAYSHRRIANYSWEQLGSEGVDCGVGGRDGCLKKRH